MITKTDLMQIGNNDPNMGSNEQRKDEDRSIGNQQETTQTGGQNQGGDNRSDTDDRYDEDLQRSGDRKSNDE
jgi:hypothetical protein